MNKEHYISEIKEYLVTETDLSFLLKADEDILIKIHKELAEYLKRTEELRELGNPLAEKI